MFVRNPHFFEHGDIVEATKEISIPLGKFTVGHRFIITGTRNNIATEMRCPETGYTISESSGIYDIKFAESKQSTNDYDRPVSSQFQDR